MSYTRENHPHNWNPFSLDQWIYWLGATIVAAISMMIFLYSNFQTKDNFQDYKEDQKEDQKELIQRLDRLDHKLDRILLRKGM
jgi:sensor domain CHASE-containing protein